MVFNHKIDIIIWNVYLKNIYHLIHVYKKITTFIVNNLMDNFSYWPV